MVVVLLGILQRTWRWDPSVPCQAPCFAESREAEKPLMVLGKQEAKRAGSRVHRSLIPMYVATALSIALLTHSASPTRRRPEGRL